MLLFVLGILYANIIEYLVHRYLFHKLGKKKRSVFSFHLREHHILAKKNEFYDKKISVKEPIGISLLLIIHIPIIWFAPLFYIALAMYGIAFISIHNLVHRYPKIAKKYFWWHWNHHMRNQNQSWGVVLPITDMITKTLEPPTK